METEVNEKFNNSFKTRRVFSDSLFKKRLIRMSEIKFTPSILFKKFQDWKFSVLFASPQSRENWVKLKMAWFEWTKLWKTKEKV